MRYSTNLTVVMTLLLAFTSVSSIAASPVPPLSSRDASLLAEAYHLWESLGEEIWPGWTGIEMPIVYITEDHEYAIGFSGQPAGFQHLDEDVRIGREIFGRDRTLDPGLTASFFVSGKPAVVIGTPAGIGRAANAWVLTVAHEMFHVLHSVRGGVAKVAALGIGPADDASWHLNWPFPYDDPEVMRLIHLQAYPVYLGMMSTEEAEVRYNAGTAIDAIRVYRRYLEMTTGAPKAYDYSRFQESVEGIAFYTEWMMAKAAAHSYEPLPAFRELPDATSYAETFARTYESRKFLVKHAGRAAQNRLTFYHLGMGKGMLLDRLSPDWKQQYFAEGWWLDSLLLDATDQSEDPVLGCPVGQIRATEAKYEGMTHHAQK